MEVGTRDASAGTSYQRRSRNILIDLVVRLVKEKPLGTIGAVIVLMLLLTGIFADFLAPFEYNKTILMDRLQAPSATHILGTDNLGRDVLSRVIYGARVSMYVGLGASGLGVLISALLGAITLIPGFVAFPTAAVLLESGAGIMQIGAFVSALMMVGVITLPVEMATFGRKLSLIRNLLAFLFSFVVAFALSLVVR